MGSGGLWDCTGEYSLPGGTAPAHVSSAPQLWGSSSSHVWKESQELWLFSSAERRAFRECFKPLCIANLSSHLIGPYSRTHT